MADILKKFGRYILLDQIAQGGMAEIYRASPSTSDGTGRLVVLKRVMAGFGGNTEFLRMFKSEIKVMMGFNHPNIVQLYDFGEEENQPYIVMEYVDGKNLRQFHSRFHEKKRGFPIDLAVSIAAQSASALHYAHSYRDKVSGEPLKLVHRDVSPQNILLSYEGQVKVIDFGIAKAATVGESTRAGTIKGKPSYMAPEQVGADTLDGRCDIFALGIVLWEMLVGRKLFQADSDLAVLRMIENCQIHIKPPSSQNPEVPKELDYIVLKALAKQPEKRFQTADEMQKALQRFLQAYNPDFDAASLRQLATDIFKEDMETDQKKIRRLTEKSREILELDEKHRAEDGAPDETALVGKTEDKTVSEPASGANRSFASSQRNQRPGSPQTQVDLKTQTDPIAQSIPRRDGPSRGGRTLPGGSREVLAPEVQQAIKERGGGTGGFAAALVAGAVFYLGYHFNPELLGFGRFRTFLGLESAAFLKFSGDRNPSVKIIVDGQEVGTGIPFLYKTKKFNEALALRAELPDGRSFHRTAYLQPGQETEIDVKFESREASPPAENQAVNKGEEKFVELTVNVYQNNPPTQIQVNGKNVDLHSPKVRVELDQAISIKVTRSGYKTYMNEFTLGSNDLTGGSQRTPAGLRAHTIDIDLDPLRYGYFSLKTTPSADATIPTDGKPLVLQTPIVNQKLPEGIYKIKLVNALLGMEKIITVHIQDGRSVAMEEELKLKY